MNDKVDYNLESEEVHRVAIELLSRLPLMAHGQIPVYALLNVMIFAAAFRTSINEACGSLEGAPSPSHVLGELTQQLDDPDLLEKHINHLLASLLPKKLTKRYRRVAIDLVEVPFHGTVDKKFEGEVRRGKAKSGTTHFFTYATAYLILRGRRYTLAMVRVRAEDKMDTVLKKLLNRLKTLRIKTGLLLLDRGFYSVKVILYLICGRRAFIMPAIKRGKTEQEEGGPTRTYALAAWKASGWTRYTLHSPEEGNVSFDVAVVCRNYNGRWGRHERETLLYACWGVKHLSLSAIREQYRKRFGIESSYRQFQQARIKTCSRNPVLRLLFYGTAFLLRNVWVWLHSEVITTPRRGAQELIPASLRFQRMMLWLLFEVAKHYKLRCRVKASRELKRAFDEFESILKY